MKSTLFRILLPCCLALALTACGADQTSPAPTFPAALPSATPPPTPTLAPSATPTLKPRPTRTVYSPPTPQPMIWQVPVLQFDWPPPFDLQYARWVDENTFSFETYSDPHETYLVSLDANGSMTLSHPPDVNQPRSYSPHRRFEAECSASDLSLYRLPERKLVGSVALAVPDAIDFLSCNQSLQWAADDSALMFTIYLEPFDPKNPPRAFYLWKTNQPQPRRLATAAFEYFGGYMSPDFKHLMYFAGRAMKANNPDKVDALLADILEVASGAVTHLRLEQVSSEIYPGWLTNEVFFIRYGRYTTRYYDAKTGQYLFDFFDAMSAGGFHQRPTLSPDLRWVTLDHNFGIKRYSLYDLQTKSEILLSESPTWRLSFSGWKPDSSRLYLVNSPFKAFDPLGSPLPAGLLAYDPRTRTAVVLVPDAVRAFWSPDMRFAWVIRQSINSQRVFASLYDAASGKLSGEVFASLTPLKGDPAADFFGLDFDLRWSHDSTRALLVNARKELFLLTGSEAKLLATGSYRPVSWSPGDRYALVYYARGAWVVELGK